MNGQQVFFNDALRLAFQAVNAQQLPDSIPVLFIRDIHGRIRIAINAPKEQYPSDTVESLSQELTKLSVFNAGLLFQDELFDPDALFDNPDVVEVYIAGSDRPIRILDRQVVGQDWLRPDVHSPVVNNKPPRLVFYGLKGGVGRSTALAMLAYQLAHSGKRVLLVDFDLESPGLSGLLLPPDRLADCGMVDWFIEDAVNQGDAVLDRMISVSPLSEQTQGEIRVAAAMGIGEDFYLAKLFRIYADVARDGHVEGFSQRVRRLVNTLEVREKPDVVLIDSRTGLHDLAAVSIVSLATFAFLFAVDTAQTWQGYRLLFSHWQSHPSVLLAVRERLVMVEALFPESDQAARVSRFLQNAYTLFSETIYEQIEPGKEPVPDVFNFDMNDTAAPHYPLRIKWNNRFQEFDPLLLLKNILTEADIAATFGDFLDGAKRLIDGDAA
ncbi:MAG: AAA family ATPase [Deltaproteobacteria bacterium]|nr:AAA family ATPase [Deltaproteobacteria bacterium]